MFSIKNSYVIQSLFDFTNLHGLPICESQIKKLPGRVGLDLTPPETMKAILSSFLFCPSYKASFCALSSKNPQEILGYVVIELDQVDKGFISHLATVKKGDKIRSALLKEALTQIEKWKCPSFYLECEKEMKGFYEAFAKQQCLNRRSLSCESEQERLIRLTFSPAFTVIPSSHFTEKGTSNDLSEGLARLHRGAQWDERVEAIRDALEADVGDSFCAVAKANPTRLLGYIEVKSQSKHSSEIAHLVTAEKGHGIGTALLRCALLTAQAQKKTEIQLRCIEGVQGFYRKFGEKMGISTSIVSPESYLYTVEYSLKRT